MGSKSACRKVVITGAIVIWSIKFLIRPSGVFDGATSYLLGIAPNLVGSFLVPFAACWFFSGRKFFMARVFRLGSLLELRMVCMLGMGMLTFNEYLQLIPYFGRTFDYHDILSSAAGLFLSYFVFARFLHRLPVQGH